MNNLSIPITDDKIRALKVGNEVKICGVVFTGRDAARLASIFRWR